MLAPPGDLLRAGLGLKIAQLKLATRSYLRDRTNQATGTVGSYAVAAGLFAAAGVFLIAATLVGVTALFRFIEIEYGPFWAFGAVGALLVVIAGICAGIGSARLNRPTRRFPSLTSRLRVAVKANPIRPGQIEAVRDTATAILLQPSAPAVSNRGRTGRRLRGDNRNVQAGLALGALLLGWAATRRRQQTRRTGV